MGSTTRLPSAPAVRSPRSTSRPGQLLARDVRGETESDPSTTPSVRIEPDSEKRTPDRSTHRISALDDRVRDLREKQWNVLEQSPVDWARLARLSEAIYEIERRKLILRRGSPPTAPAGST